MKREAQKETTVTPHGAQIMTRIYIQQDGNLLVTDYWEEIERLLAKNFKADDQKLSGEGS